MSDNLSKIFDIVEVVHTDNKKTTIIPDGDEKADHQFARTAQYNLINTSNEALDVAMKILRETENPKAVEAMSGLIKSLSDANKTLIVMNKDKYDASASKKEAKPTIGNAVQNQTNIMFTGDSSEMNKFIEAQLKNNKKE